MSLALMNNLQRDPKVRPDGSSTPVLVRSQSSVNLMRRSSVGSTHTPHPGLFSLNGFLPHLDIPSTRTDN
jgi:hypothetical protein